MYGKYWGLQREPFGSAPSAAFYYPSAQHDEALFRLLFAVEHHKGVAVLTGEVGAGKTTVLRTLQNRLTQVHCDIVAITNPALDPVDLIRSILLGLEEPASEDSKALLLGRLDHRLRNQMASGRDTLVIVDEAHSISNPATFEELRMLLNHQQDDRFLLTLLLVGQPPLAHKIAALQPLNERVSVRYHLKQLGFVEMVRYIQFRLRKAGAKRGVFTRPAIEAIFRATDGLPLRVNRICDRAMLVGMMQSAQSVDSETVEAALADLGSST